MLWIPFFCDEIEGTRVPPGRPSRTISGTRAAGCEPLIYTITGEKFCSFGPSVDIWVSASLVFDNFTKRSVANI